MQELTENELKFDASVEEELEEVQEIVEISVDCGTAKRVWPIQEKGAVTMK